MKNKILALVLSIAMTIALAPAIIFAENEVVNEPAPEPAAAVVDESIDAVEPVVEDVVEPIVETAEIEEEAEIPVVTAADLTSVGITFAAEAQAYDGNGVKGLFTIDNNKVKLDGKIVIDSENDAGGHGYNFSAGEHTITITIKGDPQNKLTAGTTVKVNDTAVTTTFAQDKLTMTFKYIVGSAPQSGYTVSFVAAYQDTSHSGWGNDAMKVTAGDVTFTGDSTQTVEEGETPTAVSVAAKADGNVPGAVFDGWYTDQNYQTAFSFETPVTENTTVYAKWKYTEVTTVTITTNGNKATISANGVMKDATKDISTVGDHKEIQHVHPATQKGYMYAGSCSDAEPHTASGISVTVDGKTAGAYFCHYGQKDYGVCLSFNMKKDISDTTICKITGPTDTVYNANQQKASFTVKYNEVDLVQGTEFELWQKVTAGPDEVTTADDGGWEQVPGVETNVGTYTYKVVGIGDYTGEQAEFDWSITPAPAKVRAVDKTKQYGAKDPKLTYVTEGVLGNDVLKGISLSREPGEKVGDYLISVSVDEESNPNYEVTAVDGNFEITKAEEKGVQTGDDNQLGLMSLVFGLALASFMALAMRRRMN